MFGKKQAIDYRVIAAGVLVLGLTVSIASIIVLQGAQWVHELTGLNLLVSTAIPAAVVVIILVRILFLAVRALRRAVINVIF